MEFKKNILNPRVINDLQKRSIGGIIFFILIACIILSTDNYYERHPQFSLWFLLLITVTSLFRAVHLWAAKWIDQKFETPNKIIFLLSVALTQFIWGIGLAKFMIEKGEPNAQLVMVMSAIGLGSGGVVAYIPYLKLSVACPILMTMPTLVILAINNTNRPFILLIVIFIAYLSFIAFRGNKEYWKALKNEDLLYKRTRALEKISRIDSLTNLYNRRYFDQAYSFEWNRSCRDNSVIAIVICDIDNFKKINDQYGHPAGDKYLKAVAKTLKTVFKRKIDITARFGGEEFIIIVLNETSKNVKTLAEKIRSKIESLHLKYDTQIIKTTISIGIASCSPHKDIKSHSLIKNADDALYKSKKNGRNQITEH